jgi:hypothetical protein
MIRNNTDGPPDVPQQVKRRQAAIQNIGQSWHKGNQSKAIALVLHVQARLQRLASSKVEMQAWKLMGTEKTKRTIVVFSMSDQQFFS